MNGWVPDGGYRIQPGRELRRDSNFVGIITISQTVLLQLSFVILLIPLGMAGVVQPAEQYYGMGKTAFLIFYSFAYALGMGLPAPVVAAIARRNIRPFDRLENAEYHVSLPSAVLALLAGLSFCILANFATMYIVYFLSQLGLYPPEMPSYIDKTGLSLGLNIFVFCLLPAILEEMIYRGYILRTLRRHGDGFALVVSSALFALMHGNILQIPFAFIVGMVCGYLVIKTGRIWLGMMLHFLNNFMSTLLSYADLFTATDELKQKMYLIVFSIIGTVGLIALLILFAMSDPIVRRDQPRASEMTAGQKTGSLLLAPAMIISILISLLLTIYTTKWGG